MRRRTLHDGSPAAAGLAPAALQRAIDRLREGLDRRWLSGAVLVVARRGVVALRVALGRVAAAEGARRLQVDDLFLTASLTKPLVCLTVLKLVEQGLLRLDDPAVAFVPELRGKHARRIQIRHLLTHTSGLPDMLPNNEELRARHAPLSEFVAHLADVDCGFAPGTNCRYQSLGLLLLAEIAARLTGQSMRDLLHEALFGPLGLRTSVLGLREGYERRLVPVHLPPADAATDWHWNSPYWRGLGAPWGGLHSTADELAVVLQMMLNGGSYGDVEVLAPATVEAAIANQTARLPELPAAVKAQQPWGFGWRLVGEVGGPAWPELASPRTFGHTGATGTIFWADPESEILFVLLTTEPGGEARRLRAVVSNIIGAAWV